MRLDPTEDSKHSTPQGPGVDLVSRNFGFPLDDFQTRAMDRLDFGESVVVSAPTGSGKTVVAEYAIRRALARGGRAFYTTPIKALSNQKFSDLSSFFGSERVGLLTGDNVVNPDASILVMTTEVLRNMLYAHSRALDELSVVVLDEVHFIQDAYRGPVWEEVIIHLAYDVQLVCLSATVSNAPEIAEWITTVRGATQFIVEDKRPVELEVLVMIGEQGSGDLLLPIFSGGGINQRLQKLCDQIPIRRGSRQRRSGRPLRTPRRTEVIETLRSEDLLPVIYFIFSRQGCDDAAATVARELPTFTSSSQRSRIDEILERKVKDLDPDDLMVLGYEAFKERLERGVASHHAGLVPPFKEAVEECFSEGLIRVVFATETLAVGINMPARSVVIDKLTKFTGEHHEFLSASQFTQLTGRAGRRGLDAKGHAVLLWSPFVSLEQMGTLASSKSFRLTSSFRPTYNMAVNLVNSYTRDESRHLLNLSLAQFQNDKNVVKIESRTERKIRELREAEGLLYSPHGTPEDYLNLVSTQEIRETESGPGPIEDSLAVLRPGAIIRVDKGRYHGPAAVMSTARRAKGFKITVLTSRRSLLQLVAADFTMPPSVTASIDLPEPFNPTRQDFQRRVVDRMARAVRSSPKSLPMEVDMSRSQTLPFEEELLKDPELDKRRAAARKVLRLRSEIPELEKQVDLQSSSIVRSFERVLTVLEQWEFVAGWELNTKGMLLSRLFHESDLLIAECLSRGLLDDLPAPELAAILSVFVYEHRSSDPAPPPWFPSKECLRRWSSIQAVSVELRSMEIAEKLPPHKAPDATYVSVAYSWAVGDRFGDVVEDEDLTGGDFVRHMKQLVDLLRQIALVSPNDTTRTHAAQAEQLILRDVVQVSSSLAESST